MIPKIVGLTGGIGSGKTTVANFFAALDIPIYTADVEAKLLMNRSKIIKRKLKQLFGDQAYKDDKLNKSFISEKIFNDKDLLQKMNAIVHPKVAKHFSNWVKKQKSSYVISEAAIIFENGSYKKYDFIITVVAPQEIRLKRVIERDQSTKEKVKIIMKNQWNDDKKVALSNFIITNTDLDKTKIQVKNIHKELLKIITKQ